MTEIEIDVKANIFDDPEYCAMHAGDATQYCRHYNRGECGIFEQNPIENEKVNSEPIKSKQCKDSWSQAKGTKYTGCVLDLGENDIPDVCVIDSDDFSDSDCIYSEKGLDKSNCGFWKTRLIKKDRRKHDD